MSVLSSGLVSHRQSWRRCYVCSCCQLVLLASRPPGVYQHLTPRGALLTPSRVCVLGKPSLTVASSPRVHAVRLVCFATQPTMLQPHQPAPADPHLPTRPAHPPLTASPVDTPLPTSPADSHRVASACRCASTTSEPRRRSCLRCDACCTVRSVWVASFRDDCKRLFSRHITDFRATLYVSSFLN